MNMKTYSRLITAFMLVQCAIGLFLLYSAIDSDIMEETSLKSLIYVASGFIILFSILSILLMVRYVMHPVNRLYENTRYILDGDKSTSGVSGAGYDLECLSLSIKQFIDAHIKLESEMDENREKLDRMVEKATAELTDENNKLRDRFERLIGIDEKLKKTMSDLARSNSELEQFAYVASHDLQEPLRMITSYVQLLERRYKGKLDRDADDFINYAVDGATRMKRLINDLLTYSRVGTRAKPFKTVDCSGILDQTLGDLEMTIHENGAVVTRGTLPKVLADPSQMNQLFQNLIGNAIKFRGRESPSVHISAKEDEDKWIFSVRDNGIGIDPQYAERIFQVFQRLHTISEYPGTGIGLAVCKKIVERHGGKIWVEGNTEKGSTFFYTIPKSEEE